MRQKIAGVLFNLFNPRFFDSITSITSIRDIFVQESGGDGERAVLEFENALLELFEFIAGNPGGFGSSPLKRSARIEAAICYLKNIICPQKEKLLARSDSAGGNLVVIISDTIASAIGSLPLPIATISRELARIGLDRFCKNPFESILND